MQRTGDTYDFKGVVLDATIATTRGRGKERRKIRNERRHIGLDSSAADENF